MKRTAIIFILLILCASLLSSCDWLLFSPAIAGLVGGSTWIDAPLHGSVLPLATHEVVFHAADPDGVALVELLVNDVLIFTQDNTTAQEPLVTGRTDWTPQSTGQYTLLARTQNITGEWSSEAVSVVTIADDTPTPTPSPSATPTSTATPTATATPTPTATEPETGELIFTHSAEPKQMHFGGCEPAAVAFEVTVTGAAAVNSVDIYLRLQDQVSGEMTPWDDGRGMFASPSIEGLYRRTIIVTEVEDHDKYANATLVYQYIATDKDGNVLGRTPRLFDVSIAVCGTQPEEPPPPPPAAPSPTPTPTVAGILVP